MQAHFQNWNTKRWWYKPKLKVEVNFPSLFQTEVDLSYCNHGDAWYCNKGSKTEAKKSFATRGHFSDNRLETTLFLLNVFVTHKIALMASCIAQLWEKWIYKPANSQSREAIPAESVAVANMHAKCNGRKKTALETWWKFILGMKFWTIT